MEIGEEGMAAAQMLEIVSEMVDHLEFILQQIGLWNEENDIKIKEISPELTDKVRTKLLAIIEDEKISFESKKANLMLMGIYSCFDWTRYFEIESIEEKKNPSFSYDDYILNEILRLKKENKELIQKNGFLSEYRKKFMELVGV